MTSEECDRDCERTIETLKGECSLLEEVLVCTSRRRWYIRGRNRNAVVIDVNARFLQAAVRDFREAYHRSVAGGLLK